jgi:hypothetical protein
VNYTGDIDFLISRLKPHRLAPERRLDAALFVRS